MLNFSYPETADSYRIFGLESAQLLEADINGVSGITLFVPHKYENTQNKQQQGSKNSVTYGFVGKVHQLGNLE